MFVDPEKAFDTVHHEILCEKIKAYGLRGNVNKLLQSYLSDRKQYVSINGFDSDVKKCVLWSNLRVLSWATPFSALY